MYPEKTDLWEMVFRTGKKGELEMEKMYYLLLDLQGILRQEQKEHPEFYRIMDLERLDTIISDARIEIIRIKDLMDRLNGSLKRLRREPEAERAADEKPFIPDPYYQHAVAEQEKDLYQIWPAKYGIYGPEE